MGGVGKGHVRKAKETEAGMIGSTERRAMMALKVGASAGVSLDVERIGRMMGYGGLPSSLRSSLRRLMKRGYVEGSGRPIAYRLTARGCIAMGSFPAKGENMAGVE